MARLTPENWAALRADFEAHKMTFGELAKKYGVNKSTISRRAKSEGWDQNATQEIISQTIENEKKRITLGNELSALNATTQRAANAVIIDRLAFEMQSNQDLQIIRDMVIKIVHCGDDIRMSDLKHAMEILIKQREAMLGKQPDTAISINQQTPQEIVRTIIDPQSANA